MTSETSAVPSPIPEQTGDKAPSPVPTFQEQQPLRVVPEPTAPVKRKPGRPKGSKNKATAATKAKPKAKATKKPAKKVAKKTSKKAAKKVAKKTSKKAAKKTTAVKKRVRVGRPPKATATKVPQVDPVIQGAIKAITDRITNNTKARKTLEQEAKQLERKLKALRSL